MQFLQIFLELLSIFYLIRNEALANFPEFQVTVTHFTDLCKTLDPPQNPEIGNTDNSCTFSLTIQVTHQLEIFLLTGNIQKINLDKIFFLPAIIPKGLPAYLAYHCISKKFMITFAITSQFILCGVGNVSSPYIMQTRPVTTFCISALLVTSQVVIHGHSFLICAVRLIIPHTIILQEFTEYGLDIQEQFELLHHPIIKAEICVLPAHKQR